MFESIKRQSNGNHHCYSIFYMYIYNSNSGSALLKNLIFYLYPRIHLQSLLSLHWFLRGILFCRISWRNRAEYSRLPKANSHVSCTFKLNVMLHLSSNQREAPGKGRWGETAGNRTGIKPTYAGLIILKVESESPVWLVPWVVIASPHRLLTGTNNSSLHCCCIKSRTVLPTDCKDFFF